MSATILVLTDRLDLNDQLHSTFAACSDYLRQTPVKAIDGDHLYELLEKRKSHGIIFANIQKFLEEKGVEIVSAEFERIPNDYKEVTPEQREAIEKLLERFEDDEDVQNVFHNMKDPED